MAIDLEIASLGHFSPGSPQEHRVNESHLESSNAASADNGPVCG
jgi:hypothetical protein